MQEHCRIKHQWKNDWEKGGNVRQQARQTRRPVPWREGVQAQQVCHWGHGRRWFKVSQAINQYSHQQTRSQGQGQEDDQADREHQTAMQFFKTIHNDNKQAFKSKANGNIQTVDNK
ncbi:putative ATP-dependent dna helicase q1 [Fusarium flagelliforme]|uniref:Putative ATP-dependent dna helicase q1 n=1 Tax=Fusarium flagelliforme TaxID=2675880 RepID=A0A395M4Y2_9HYPO|nr:putative ATP-dependent dna helicase q1 [Fusarium flagelliforme]